MIGLYVPGTSLLHRSPAWLKLLTLTVGISVMLIVRTAPAVAVGLAVTVALYLATRLGLGVLLRQLWPLRWILLVLTVFQVLTRGAETAWVSVGGLLVAVAAAALVSLTTRTEDMIETMTAGLRPLRVVGVKPDRVALAFALAIRAIPVLAETLRQVDEARKARGLERSLRALLVPVVVRTVRHAMATGEALAARGLDDDLD